MWKYNAGLLVISRLLGDKSLSGSGGIRHNTNQPSKSWFFDILGQKFPSDKLCWWKNINTANTNDCLDRSTTLVVLINSEWGLWIDSFNKQKLTSTCTHSFKNDLSNYFFVKVFSCYFTSRIKCNRMCYILKIILARFAQNSVLAWFRHTKHHFEQPQPSFIMNHVQIPAFLFVVALSTMFFLFAFCSFV